jgi:predicted transcriptional regulator of viral defense system
LLAIVGDEPVFETGLLLSGDRDPADVRRQLSRWVTAGQLHRLRRGLYALAPPYVKTRPHPFLVANQLVRGSYVSLQSALAHHGLIPEHVPVTTSVTTGRPGEWSNPFGRFQYRHLRKSVFGDFRLESLGGAQRAFVATPAKALADLVDLVPGADSPAYLHGLRLDVEAIGDLETDATRLAARPKVRRAFARLATLAEVS